MYSLVIREMQIKTTMRYHFTSIRITIILKVKKKEQKITSIGKDVRKWSTHKLATVENSLTIPQKIKHRNYYITQQFYF